MTTPATLMARLSRLELASPTEKVSHVLVGYSEEGRELTHDPDPLEMATVEAAIAREGLRPVAVWYEGDTAETVLARTRGMPRSNQPWRAATNEH